MVPGPLDDCLDGEEELGLNTTAEKANKLGSLGKFVY